MPPRAATRLSAQCPVCISHRDLGCLDVIVDDDTPRSSSEGVTWYFCCKRCKAAFDKNPAKYIRIALRYQRKHPAAVEGAPARPSSMGSPDSGNAH